MSSADDEVRLYDVNVAGGPVDRAALIETIKQAVAESGVTDTRAVESAVTKAVERSRAIGRRGEG